MNIKTATISVLQQLNELLSQIRPEDYTLKDASLNASIGQHVRHIIEFYIQLFAGLDSGVINYDERLRDRNIENDRDYAVGKVNSIVEKISCTGKNKDLMQELKYGDITDSNIIIPTNYHRELAYNIEHTIHHLAIIKTALKDICDYIELPFDFGVASSTVRYLQQK